MLLVLVVALAVPVAAVTGSSRRTKSGLRFPGLQVAGAGFVARARPLVLSAPPLDAAALPVVCRRLPFRLEERQVSFKLDNLNGHWHWHRQLGPS